LKEPEQLTSETEISDFNMKNTQVRNTHDAIRAELDRRYKELEDWKEIRVSTDY
jgi:hypothetical protein